VAIACFCPRWLELTVHRAAYGCRQWGAQPVARIVTGAGAASGGGRYRYPEAVQCLELYKDRLARGLAAVVNCSTQTRLCSEVDSPISPNYTSSFRALSDFTPSPTISTHRSRAHSMAIQVECVALPGFGQRPYRNDVPICPCSELRGTQPSLLHPARSRRSAICGSCQPVHRGGGRPARRRRIRGESGRFPAGPGQSGRTLLVGRIEPRAAGPPKKDPAASEPISLRRFGPTTPSPSRRHQCFALRIDNLSACKGPPFVSP
jgi:hypothetical protein